MPHASLLASNGHHFTFTSGIISGQINAFIVFVKIHPDAPRLATSKRSAPPRGQRGNSNPAEWLGEVGVMFRWQSVSPFLDPNSKSEACDGGCRMCPPAWEIKLWVCERQCWGLWHLSAGVFDTSCLQTRSRLRPEHSLTTFWVSTLFVLGMWWRLPHDQFFPSKSLFNSTLDLIKSSEKFWVL